MITHFNISDKIVVTVHFTFFLIVEGISTKFGSCLQCFTSYGFRTGNSTRIGKHRV